MDVSAGSSSSTVNSSSSSDTEVKAKRTNVKKARISKSSGVSMRHKHRRKFQMTKQKHHHTRNPKHDQHHSLSDSEPKHRKSSSGVGNPHKRKRRHSPSTSLSETSSEMSSDNDASTDESCVSSIHSSSEQECSSRKLRKHSKPSAKQQRKKTKHLHKTSKGKKLRAVFREHFAALALLVSCPEQLAAQLYSKSLISSGTLDKVITLPMSRQHRVLHLLLDLDRKIRADPEKLFVLIQVIQGDPSLEELAEKMLHLAGRCTSHSMVITTQHNGKAPKSATTSSHCVSSLSVDGVTDEEVAQPKQPDSPECTADTESVTRGVVEEGDSNHHSSEDAAGPNYAPITNQAPPVFSAIARYQHYLKSLYKAKHTQVDDKLFIGPCAQYINLAIIKKGQLCQKEADKFTRATLHGGVDEILCQKEQVHFEDIFVTKSESPLKCILVEGPPGIGKSTFAWELCHKWDELETMQQYSLVVLLKLREKRIQNCKNLSEILNHPTDPTLGQAVVDEILEGECVLLILDGFDEFPSTLLKEDNCLVRQLISGSCLPKATVVVTSRPSARMSFELCQPQVSKHIEIIGFTEEDRVKYAESVFSSQPDMLVDFLKYIFSNPTIKTMMYIPLVCAIVAQIYKECWGARKLIPRTMTQLYTALCRTLLRRYLVENSQLNSDERMPTDFKDLPQDVYEHLCTLSKIAHDGILSETLVFYRHELPEGFEHMGFMNECRELYVDRGMESSYNFIHLSLQEYLAAWHISQLPSTQQKTYYERELCTPLYKISPKKFPVVTLFLAGITGSQNILRDVTPFQFREVISLQICRWIYEAQDINICQQKLCSLVTVNIEASKLVDFSISDMDFYALGYCIAHSRCSWRIHAQYRIWSDNGTEALEMLVNGIGRESKHHSPTGFITELKFYYAKLSTGIAWLKLLPQPVLSQLSVLALSQCQLCPKSFKLLAEAIVMMPNLHSLDVSFNCIRPVETMLESTESLFSLNSSSGEAVPESLSSLNNSSDEAVPESAESLSSLNDNSDEAVPVCFFESLSSLKRLECLRINDSNIDSHDALKVLTNFIRTSNTLRSLHVGIQTSFESDLDPPLPVSVLKKIIPSALASRTLKEFELHGVTMADMMQLSYLLPTNSSITTLTFSGELQQCNNALAYLSQALYTNTSLILIMESGFYNSGDPSAYSKFSREEIIALLNDALQQNINLRNLKLYIPSLQLHPLQRLAHQLRRGPSGPQLKLQRAQSLPCLSKYRHSTMEFPGRKQLSRNHSVLELALIDSICSLHPSVFHCTKLQ